MMRLARNTNNAKRLRRQHRSMKKTQDKSSNSRDQSPECEKTVIVGKKIENNGVLDLSQELGEIKRIFLIGTM